MDLPIIAITMGDPASIGPEIAIKALLERKIHDICKPILVGDAKVFEQINALLKLNAIINAIDKVADAKFELGTIDVLDLKNIAIDKLVFGEISAMCGEASFQSIKKVIELALAKEVDATVTGPINKKSINEAGHHFAGRSRLAWAKYADALRNISLAWRSCFTSRSRSLIRSRSALVAPSRIPLSRSACRTQTLNVSGIQPILGAIAATAADCVS